MNKSELIIEKLDKYKDMKVYIHGQHKSNVEKYLKTQKIPYYKRKQKEKKDGYPVYLFGVHSDYAYGFSHFCQGLQNTAGSPNPVVLNSLSLTAGVLPNASSDVS